MLFPSLCLEIMPVLLRPHLSALLSRVICGLDNDDDDDRRRRRRRRRQRFPRISLRGLIHGKDKARNATGRPESGGVCQA